MKNLLFILTVLLTNITLGQKCPYEINVEYKKDVKVLTGNQRLIYKSDNNVDKTMLWGTMVRLKSPEYSLNAVRLALQIQTENLENDTILEMYKTMNFFTWPNKNERITFTFQNNLGNISRITLNISNVFDITYTGKSVVHTIGINIPENELKRFTSDKLLKIDFSIYGEPFNVNASFPTIFSDFMKCFNEN